jgi:hypothetical protein
MLDPRRLWSARLLAASASALVVALITLAARADAYVYWTNDVRAPMAL